MLVEGIPPPAVFSVVKTLIHRFLVAFVLVAACRVFAAAPESAAGMVYYDDTVTFMRTQASEARLLRADGTYRSLFYLNSYGSIRLGNPVDGTWRYRKTGPDTAELSFAGDNDVRTLTFSSDAHGTLRGVTNTVLYGTFKLVDSAQRAPLVNTSNRSFVPAGGAAIAGFVVTENTNYALIRAVGPGLSAFGVSSPLATPMLELAAADRVIARNSAWEEGIGAESVRRTTEFAGAFPLQAGSRDAAIIVPLAPGAYTVKATSADSSAAGEVLIEVYLLR